MTFSEIGKILEFGTGTVGSNTRPQMSRQGSGMMVAPEWQTASALRQASRRNPE
ncbi:MAG TPA: hypothetical protein VN455_03575 [Methanotrichaceae archaeon]|nr:hypothetical protein [Methanotrichaceae archaeon]